MGGMDEAREALREGAALARMAAREAWAPLSVCTAGWAAVFTAGRGGLPEGAAFPLAWTGLLLVLLMTPSKLGALHRLAARDEAPDRPGQAGLQLTALDVRLAATATALCGAVVLGLASTGAAAILALTAPSPLPRLQIGALGPLGVDVLLLTPGLLAALAGLLSVAGRLMVTLAADAAEPAPRFARGWILTRGAGAAPALVLLLATLLPLAGVFGLETSLDALAEGGRAGPGAWSIPQAAAAGLVLAALTQFALAPLSAGALAHLRRSGRAREAAAERTVDTPGPLGDKAPPRPPAPAPELLAT